MPNLTSVGITNGSPSSGTGTVSTIDALLAVLPAALAANGGLKIEGVANGVSVPVTSRGVFVTCTTDITRPADTTAYAANDALSNSTSAPTSGGFTFTGAARTSGGSGIITDMWIGSTAATGSMQGEIWLFDQAVTNVNDNAAFAISDAENKTVVGVIPFTTGAGTNNAGVHVQNLNIGFTCVGSADLRYLVKIKAAYTPASGEVITTRLKIMQVD